MVFSPRFPRLIGSILLVCAFVLLAAPRAGHAQSLDWGVRLSAQVSTFDFEEPLPFWSTSSRAFPAVAVDVRLPLSGIEGPLGRRLRFTPGLRYVRLSGQVDFETALGGQVFAGLFTIDQHYLAVPLMLELAIGTLPVYVIAGPEVAILVKAERTSKTTSPEADRSSDTRNITGDVRRLHTALYGGLGGRLTSRIDVFARYGFGLSTGLRGGEQTVSVTDWSAEEVEFGIRIDFGR